MRGSNCPKNEWPASIASKNAFEGRLKVAALQALPMATSIEEVGALSILSK
jgi:hypothetical protein